MDNTGHNLTTFKDWYNSLPANIQTERRNEICQKCEWSLSAFYKKINGYSPVKNPEKLLINSITKTELDYDSVAAKAFGLTQ